MAEEKKNSTPKVLIPKTKEEKEQCINAIKHYFKRDEEGNLIENNENKEQLSDYKE